MSTLNPTSTGHDWNHATSDERKNFCLAQPCPNLDNPILQDALTILYRTNKKSICNISLGQAVELLVRDRETLS